MTKEEAIEFGNMWLQINEDCKDSSTYKFFQMAVKALEQEPVLDKIRVEIIDTLYVDSLIFGELIDFQNGKISADDVIEEFNRVTKLEVLKILDKYKTESEADGIVISRNLCDFCKTKGCIFQSGIVRSHCDFYKSESEVQE